MWERFSLPMAVFGASAHPPQAPIWLDPSGCPPGRVFYFHSRIFPDRIARPRVTVKRLEKLDKPRAPHPVVASCWTSQKVFHKIMPSFSVDSPPLRRVRVRFFPYGLVHDTSTGRGDEPRSGGAMVRTRRAAAGISHRNVRERPLAAFPQRARLSRK